ncbi:MAG TPA: site-specific DNA-methyltransferase, partial [Acetobacteraceae bacterium]|nr:site-specific DNA-methyltransferase [Acetobacteraceae bacterium]
FVGVEREQAYIDAASERIAAIKPLSARTVETAVTRRNAPRVAFGALVEMGLITPGTELYDDRRRFSAMVRADGSLVSGQHMGSIHRVGALVQGAEACNGWTFWHASTDRGLAPIDIFRAQVRAQMERIPA